MARFGRVMIAGAVLALMMGDAIAQVRPVPYFASISAGQARIRTGPGRNYPATWEYQRRGLPVKVIETYPAWRRIQDPDGTIGWMQANLLSEDRTAMITGEIRPLRAKPEADADIVWRAEPGVVGKLVECENRWCELDIDGRRGYVEEAHLWGVAPGETVD